MLGRLGFTGRLMAIVLLALIALWALGAGWAYVSQAPGDSHALLPLTGQTKAIVEMLEANPERRSVLLEAVNSDVLNVTVIPERPAVASDVRRLVAIEWLIGRYVEALGTRDVIAIFEPSDTPWWRQVGLGRYGLYARRPLRLAISLKTGGYVLFETHGEIARRLFGLPPGFWMGALGSLIGIAAILAIMREARPLRELSAAVARFTGEAKPFAVRARGAPEIRNLITAVNDMQARIAALVKGRTVLIGAVSHDLKTYITRLRMRAEMLVEDGQRERAVRDLEDMTTLIDDALAVVRGGAVYDRREMLDLVPLIQADAADRPQGALEIFRPEAPPLLVNGDAAALRRLFGNLIDNALRFGRTCRVTVTRHGDFAAVLVDDDGPGIPPSERLAVFEPFYRLEPSRSRTTGGSGLGLAIAKQIVETHGGSIAVEASPLKGARLRVEIPAAEDRHRAVKVRPTQ